MATESKIVRELRNKIENYFRENELAYEVKPEGSYWVRQGSTIVVVTPLQWGEDEKTLVKLAAPVSLEIKKVSSELTRFLVEKNNELLFGKFSLDTPNKGIWYEHTLLGDFLDAEELFSSLVGVALAADEFDEQICKMSGGKRFVDL